MGGKTTKKKVLEGVCMVWNLVALFEQKSKGPWVGVSLFWNPCYFVKMEDNLENYFLT